MPDCVFGTRIGTHVILIYDRSCARMRICERLNYAKEVAVSKRSFVALQINCFNALRVFLEASFSKIYVGLLYNTYYLPRKNCKVLILKKR